MELPLLNASGKPIRPPFLWYYSGWTREGVPDPAFGIKQVVHSPANHDNDFVDRDNVNETENPGLVVEGEHTLGLTTFPVESIYKTEINENTSMYNSLPVIDEYQDVKRFFERPRLISTGTLSASRGNLSYLEVSEPVSQYWPAAAVNRLNGVFGYRCSIKFTVTVASTPFQQGLIAACFQYGAVNSSTINLARHNFTALTTNLPHARLNLADQTMCEVTVPYISPFEFFELANGLTSGGDNAGRVYSFGVFSLNQILPYYALASGAPVYKVYVSLHDMELFGAVPVATSAIIPQSGVKNVAKVDKVPKAMREEKEKKHLGGFISTTGKVVTGGALLGALGSAVLGRPETSAKCLESAAIAASVTKTAEAMGYSKPVGQENSTVVMPTETSHEWHVDMPSNASVVGPFQSNEMVIDAGPSGTNVDEMDLDFVLGSYCQAFHGSINSADAGGTILYATNLCPTSFWFRSRSAGRPGGNLAMPVSATVSTNCFLPTALCYISQMFKYWRGSIKFRFTFAKTKFHAGRVIAAYVPASYDTVATGVLSNNVPAPEISSGLVQPFQYSTIFDLKDNSVFEFEVPYICSRPFMSTLGTTGGVTLTVVDPLLITGETSNEVAFLVEVCAGPDFQLADYVGSGLGPCSTTAGATSMVVYQSGLVDEGVEVYTSGERFNSVKQLAMIPYSTVSTFAGSTSYITALPPFYYAPVISAAVPMPATTTAFAACSAPNLIARMYAYCSGSTVYGAYTSVTNGVLSTIQQNIYDRANPTPGTSDTRNKTGAHKPKVIKTGYNASIVAKAPSYQKYSLIPCNSVSFNSNFAPGTAPINGSAFAPSAYRHELTNNNTTSGLLTLTYAAGDDARFVGYIGPPPCWLLQSTQTANLDSSAYGNWN